MHAFPTYPSTNQYERGEGERGDKPEDPGSVDFGFCTEETSLDRTGSIPDDDVCELNDSLYHPYERLVLSAQLAKEVREGGRTKKECGSLPRIRSPFLHIRLELECDAEEGLVDIEVDGRRRVVSRVVVDDVRSILCRSISRVSHS